MPDYLNTQVKIGDRLKEIRTEKNIEIQKVSQDLKIRRKYIEAIEEGNYDVFSSEVYAKGFLRNYAKYLGMDPEKALSLYRRERVRSKEGAILQKSSPRFSAPKGLSLTWSSMGLLLGAIAVIGAIVFFGYRIVQVRNRPTLILTDPLSADVREGNQYFYDTFENSLTIKGRVEPGDRLFINNTEHNTRNIDIFEIRNLDLREGENTFDLTARNQIGFESNLRLTVIKSEQEVPEPTPLPEEITPSVTEIDNEN